MIEKEAPKGKNGGVGRRPLVRCDAPIRTKDGVLCDFGVDAVVAVVHDVLDDGFRTDLLTFLVLPELRSLSHLVTTCQYSSDLVFGRRYAQTAPKSLLKRLPGR